MQIHLPPAWAIKVLNEGKGGQGCSTVLHSPDGFTTWTCALHLFIITHIAGIVQGKSFQLSSLVLCAWDDVFFKNPIIHHLYWSLAQSSRVEADLITLMQWVLLALGVAFSPFSFTSLELCSCSVPQRHLPAASQHFSSVSNLPCTPWAVPGSWPLLPPHVLPIRAETSAVASSHLIKPSFLSKSHISPSLSPLPGARAERFHYFINSPQALPTPVLPLTTPSSIADIWCLTLAHSAHQ